MSTLPPVLRPEKRRRNKFMCRQCRNDKQRCNPAERDWNKRQKCDRCGEMGYGCGPSESKAGVPRESGGTASAGESNTSSTIPELETFAETLFSDGPVITKSSAKSSHRGTKRPAVVEQPARPLPTPYGCGDNPWPDSDPPSSQLTVDDIARPRRKDSEVEARCRLAELGDQLATRQIICSDLRSCDQVEEWIGPDTLITQARASLSAAAEAIRTDFETTYKHASSLGRRDLGPSKEAFIAQVLLLGHRFRDPPPGVPARNDEWQHVESGLWDLLHMSHKRKHVDSDADYLCCQTAQRVPGDAPPNTEGETVAAYLRASKGISEVLSNIVLTDIEHHKFLFGSPIGFNHATSPRLSYPACHLTVNRASPSVSLELWKKSPGQTWEIDCLRRTPLHVAAYAGCIEDLTSILQRSNEAAKDAGPDIFGITPLAISACKDDVKGFTILRKYGAEMDTQDSQGRSVLALAARNGSRRIVDLILGSGYVPPSMKPELIEAIRAGQLEVVKSFIAYYKSRPNNPDDSMQIESAVAVAQQEGYPDLAQELFQLIALSSAQVAGDYLHDMSYNYYIDQYPYYFSQSGDLGNESAYTDEIDQTLPCLTSLARALVPGSTHNQQMHALHQQHFPADGFG